MAYIEVVGVMGTGKTSLANLFNASSYGGFATITEKEEDLKRLFFNEAYLANPERYGFEGGLNYLAYHLNRLKEGLSQVPAHKDNVIVDTSLILQYAYAKDIVNSAELNVISSIIEHAYKKMPRVDLRIVPTLPIDVHMERIRLRGRDSEKSVPKSFLEATQKNLNEALEKFGKDVPTLYLDGVRYNWATNNNDKAEIRQMIQRKLGGPRNG